MNSVVIDKELGRMICRFKYTYEKFNTLTITIYTVPDRDGNDGMIEGWIFLIDSVPYYASIAGGWEQLDYLILETVAEYLNIPHKADSDFEFEDEDFAIEFLTEFEDAMRVYGYEMDEDGTWYLKNLEE